MFNPVFPFLLFAFCYQTPISVLYIFLTLFLSCYFQCIARITCVSLKHNLTESHIFFIYLSLSMSDDTPSLMNANIRNVSDACRIIHPTTLGGYLFNYAPPPLPRGQYPPCRPVAPPLFYFFILVICYFVLSCGYFWIHFACEV